MPEELLDNEYSLIHYALQRLVHEEDKKAPHRVKPQAEKLLERLENVKRVVIYFHGEDV